MTRPDSSSPLTPSSTASPDGRNETGAEAPEPSVIRRLAVTATPGLLKSRQDALVYSGEVIAES